MPATLDPLAALVPDPIAIHDRLGELSREQRLLRRQLRLALAARDELKSRVARRVHGGETEAAVVNAG